MLPSTGYFKGINCPFYDNGLCERPYCHFRHVKKESQNIANDGIESGAILQKLVSAAVQKVLQQTEASTALTTQYTTVNSNTEGVNTNTAVSKVTYNPTPIAELNKINSSETENSEEANEQRKRHIPVPYTPRKPASLPIKRPVDTNGSSKPFIYIPPPVKYTPGCTETVQLDQYTPKGSVESKEQYLPGTEIQLQEYTPNETQPPSSKLNYVPSDKNVSKKKILEYRPEKVTAKTEVPFVTYQPTPRSLAPCFSSDEEEPENKKRKLSTDLNGLDELGAEFDILDQILDEENSQSEPLQKIRKEDEIKSRTSKESKDCKENKSNHHHNKKEKEVIKSENKSLHDKSKSEKKDKSSHNKEKDEKKSKSSDKKSSHKSSSRDKERSRDEKKEKHSTDKKRHSSSNSKSSDRSSKSKHNSSSGKDSDKSSKHSISSKSDSKKHDTHNHKRHKSSKDSKERHKSKRSEATKDLSDNDSNHYEDGGGSDINEEESFDISEDEDTIALECKKIFEEYVPTEKPKISEEPVHKLDADTEEEYIPAKKRISRTANKEVKVVQKPALKPDYKMSAAQTMANRLAKVREYHAAKASSDTPNSEITNLKPDASKTSFNTPNTSSKIRIAHVPYVSSMMNAKKTISPVINTKKSEPSTSSTKIQTIQKGVQRVAHIPNDKLIDRPGVLEPLASKIPANVRSTYLNMMIDECLKIYLLPVDAYARAQHEELNTSKKCSTVQIYKNSAVLTVSRLRKELQESNGIKKSGSDCMALRNLPNAASTTGPAGSWSIVTKNRKSFDDSKEFSGSKFYNNIRKWVLSEEQLQENGFPRPHPTSDKGRAMIYGQNKKPPPKGFIRTCCRCKKEYTVDKKGFAAIKQECIYHPNNKYRIRGEVKYQCCSQDGTSDGCCVAPSHVYEYVDYENLKGYIKTLPPETVMDDYGVYSLDCEMCYTTHGLDLTRVTIINSSCKVVYETLIKPLHPIIDYNTRYSGITEEQMANVRTTLLEVQATLLTMFNSKTILVGHSLESDFKALKLIHDSVIDTSVLFPHKMGPPYKRALRNLSSEHLKKIIQNSVEGHDSAEDAMVCMELLHYKLKEDLKTR